MHFSGAPTKFEDCSLHGRDSGAELFIVEGDSASSAVTNVRNAQWQAVLPMQGKPLNAMRATGERVAEFSLFKQLVEALGVALVDIETGEVSALSGLRFERVLLLFDPDADGIHCGALMLMFFYRWMRPLLESGVVHMVRAPLFVLTATVAGHEQQVHAYSPDHAGKLISELKRRGATDIKTHHHRGLASIDPPLLASACVNPTTRKVDAMSVADAEAAIAAFGVLQSAGP
jgi:DNA gyrase subunit B